jgi:3-oxoacyl-[acyl-carrier protein] reductase
MADSDEITERLDMRDYDFSNKTVLVTGSSRGIGAGMIAAFASRGAACVVNYVEDAESRNRADAEKIAHGLKRAVVLQCDVSDTDQVRKLMSDVQREFGGLDILINNAAILRDRTLKKMAAEEWESVLRVNLDGTFNCLQAATGVLRSGGRIINMASVTGLVGLFGQANYAASKAGIMALTRVAAREFARQQVTVNAIAPGFINTEMSRGMPEETTRQFISQIPLGRFGEVEDIVAPALFLCSEHARYITGQVVHVNGGFWM